MPAGLTSSMIVSIWRTPSTSSNSAPSSRSPPLSASTTTNRPLGSGPSDRGDSDAEVGGSTSRAITATWLWAISCENVSDTAEQNGHADAAGILPAKSTAKSTARRATTRRERRAERGLGFMG